jgi:hypothetical protein
MIHLLNGKKKVLFYKLSVVNILILVRDVKIKKESIPLNRMLINNF